MPLGQPVHPQLSSRLALDSRQDGSSHLLLSIFHLYERRLPQIGCACLLGFGLASSTLLFVGCSIANEARAWLSHHMQVQVLIGSRKKKGPSPRLIKEAELEDAELKVSLQGDALHRG